MIKSLSKPIPLAFFTRYVRVSKSKFHGDVSMECCHLSSKPKHFTFPTGNLPFDIHKNHTPLFPNIVAQNRIQSMESDVDIGTAIGRRRNVKQLPIVVGRSLLQSVCLLFLYALLSLLFIIIKLARDRNVSVRVFQYREFTRILPSDPPKPQNTQTVFSKPRLSVGFEHFLLLSSLIVFSLIVDISSIW